MNNLVNVIIASLTTAPRLANQGANSTARSISTFLVQGTCTADLCYFSGRILLVVGKYFSCIIEVDFLSTETSKAVSRSLVALLSRYAVPDSVIIDNGLCHFIEPSTSRRYA